MSRKLLTILLAITVLGAVLVGSALANNGAKNNKTFKYTIGLWGDMPYSEEQATFGIPNLIADMNNSDIEFSVHDGDLKQGNGAPDCSEALYQDALTTFNSLKKPAMFTPGDNDWTDCNRPGNGGLADGSTNTIAFLDLERSIFFSTEYSMGQHQLKQEVQTDDVVTPCLDQNGDETPCVENRLWTYKGVTFATLNIQGSCNNRCPHTVNGVLPPLTEEEWAARNAANIAWLHHAFDVAAANGSSGVMLISQADPGFDDVVFDGPTRDPQTLVEDDGNLDGFYDFLVALREETIAFGKPVAYVHGDSHYFRVDKPFLDANGYRIENFTRVETFGDHADETSNGSNDVQWLKVLVDPSSRDVFAFQPQIVPANVGEYVAELP